MRSMQAQHRLRTTADFERVRRRGRSWGSELLVLYAARSDQQGTRCGFAVSRRVGQAVVRNRVRRRLREIARQRLPRLRPGWDLVFSARPTAAGASFAELGLTVDRLLDRARMLDGPGGTGATGTRSEAPSEAQGS